MATSLGTNGIGPVKVNPYALDSFMRLYFGADAMATNGLRYGAAIELRENFTGQISSNASTDASGYSSLSTVYVRRAFTYAAGENWGIVRFGMADGVIGIFDNGVTTGQFLINGFGGGDNQNVPGAGDSVLLPGHARATSTTTRNSSICRRRSPDSTSASSGRRTPRTATASPPAIR